jgi:hypothetical protein
MYDRSDVVHIELDDCFGQGARLRSRWAIRFEQPLALISQVQRSGGHLLAWLFDGHPECLAYPHELKWGSPDKYHWPSFDVCPEVRPDTLFDILDEGWPDEYTGRGGFYRALKVPKLGLPPDEPLYPFVMDTAFRRELFRRFAVNAETRRDVLNAFLSSFFNSWLDCQGIYHPKSWITAFVPRIPQIPGNLDAFFSDYADGRLISIIRHPGAWLASAKGRAYAQGRVWAQSTSSILAAAEEHPDKVIPILFEDLVLRTEDVMRFLCDCLGLPFDQRLTTPTFNGMPVLSNSSHQPTPGVDLSTIDRYRTKLEPAEIAMVEQELMPLYEVARRRFGLSGSGVRAIPKPVPPRPVPPSTAKAAAVPDTVEDTAVKAMPAVREKTLVFLLAGQSNMLGRIRETELPDEWRTENSCLRVLTKAGRTEPVFPSAGKEAWLDRFGPGLIFGHIMTREYPGTRIALVQCAKGSSSIDDWLPGAEANLYGKCMKWAKRALKHGEIGGMLWYQGEKDISRADDWKVGFSKLTASFRDEIGFEVPIVFTKIGDIGKNHAHLLDDRTAFRQMQSELDIHNSAVVDAEGLELLDDGLHLAVDGVIRLGTLYAEAMARLLGTKETELR